MHWRGILTASRLLSRGSLLSLCLLAVCHVGSQSAWATCGDYLHGHAMHGHAMHGAMIHGQGSQDVTLLITLDHAGKPTPASPGPVCRGPQCQRHSQAPISPEKAVQVPTFSDAILASLIVLDGADLQAGLSLTDADGLIGPAGRIFRPPRAV